MSVEPPVEPSADPAAPPSRRFFSPWITVLAGVVMLALTAVALWPAASGLDTLDRPEESLERVVGGELDFRAAARRAPAWERWVYDVVFSTEAEVLGDGLRWYDELVEHGASSLAELERLVLLSEQGSAPAVARALDALTEGEGRTGRLAAWAGTAYGVAAPDPGVLREALAGAQGELPETWFSDRLAGRLAARLGDHAAAAAAEERILARGWRSLHWYRAILVGQGLLVLLGLSALATLVTGGRVRAARGVGTARVPPPWTADDGVGLFTRGGVGLLGLAALAWLLPDAAWALAAVSIGSMVPLLACLVAYCRSRALSPADVFGLLPAPSARGALGRAALGLVALSTLTDLVVETVGGHLGLSPHWTDGFQEDLVWGAWDRVASDALDSIVVAPIAEEILFRGVLYGTLRLRLAPLPSAILSAAVFAGAHGYGAVGTASVFVSGVLWALAYERTRSLLPGMLAHAAGNLLATVIVLVTLRL
jgi:membrane protease YdiL (CAAX protease family)